MAALSARPGGRQRSAQALDKVTFGTNWLAEAEHGGFYQAVADGTYEKYGLDVTIVQGGPQVNNRRCCSAGKIDFYMGGNMLQAFDAVEQDIPIDRRRRDVPEGPAGPHGPPGRRASTTSSDLARRRRIFIGKEGVADLFQWMKADFRLQRRAVQALHLQSGAVHRRQEVGAAGLRDLRALRDREAGRLQAEGVPARRRRLRHLLDH